jgi:DNA polymerase III delta prime subunit
VNSYLIIGGNLNNRLDKINQLLLEYNLILSSPHPDLLSIQADPSVKIRHIREAQHFLSRKPYQAKIKALVVPEAEKMTIPAQNAFLKTLEEPPANSLIFLSSPGEEILLPTIISRCQLIRLSTNQLINNQELHTSHLSLFNSLLKAGIGERLNLIEPYEKDREEAIKFCEDMTIVLRDNLINKNQLTINPSTKLRVNNQQLTIIIKSLLQTIIYLKANVNIKLALDNWVIDLPKLTK